MSFNVIEGLNMYRLSRDVGESRRPTWNELFDENVDIESISIVTCNAKNHLQDGHRTG